MKLDWAKELRRIQAEIKQKYPNGVTQREFQEEIAHISMYMAHNNVVSDPTDVAIPYKENDGVAYIWNRKFNVN